MPDYINKKDLLRKLSEDCPQICDDKVDVYGLGAYSQYQGDINTIVNMPTIDAMEVVRCKDCKYKNLFYGDLVCENMKIGGIYYVDADFFCKEGEKDERN